MVQASCVVHRQGGLDTHEAMVVQFAAVGNGLALLLLAVGLVQRGAGLLGLVHT